MIGGSDIDTHSVGSTPSLSPAHGELTEDPSRPSPAAIPSDSCSRRLCPAENSSHYEGETPHINSFNLKILSEFE